MKKKYIVPETLGMLLSLEGQMLAGSIDVNKGNLQHGIGVSNDEVNDKTSDGRRHGRNTWEDFDDEDEEDY